MEIVKFPSAIELVSHTPLAPVPLTETDAIVVREIDVDATQVASIAGNTQGTLYIDFTIGSLTGVRLRIYGSHAANPTATEWFQEVDEVIASGVSTIHPYIIEMTATGRRLVHLPFGANRALRITAHGTGTVNTGSSLRLHLGLRNN